MGKRRFILKDAILENKLFTNRIIVMWLFMLIALSLIVVRLIFLQVTDYENYNELSERNWLKTLPLPPTRGLIFDRNGALLAENHASYGLEVTPEQVIDMEDMLKQLRQVVVLDEDDITQFKKQVKQRRRFESIPLRFRLSEDEVARFSAQRHRFNGVEITSNLSRYYPFGEHGAHIVGYVGRINEQELEVIDKTEYSGNNYIGKTGVEKYYETELRGKVGLQRVETNVRGRVLRVLESSSPVAGKDLYLNIDMKLQMFAERLVSKERAAIVAIEPDSGAVLTLVSMPSFDPNLFVNGIDAKTYQELRDSPDHPLLNRALRGQYPPGSTIKPFVGLAGLEYNVRTEHAITGCRGWYTLPGQEHRYRDWKKTGHGGVDMHRAIEQSCDVYFYSLANSLGITRLHNFMSRFGFGKKTGIDVDGELSGLLPSKEWKERVRKEAWYGGDTLIAGIGQGYILATPVQLAAATAALSTRGEKYWQPRVVLEESNSEEGKIVPIVPPTKITLKKQSYWNIAVGGMEAVVHGGRGTAHKVGARSRYRFAGKTGTAQVVGIKQDQRYNAKRLAKKFHDHALFVAFAPLDKPRIAIAIIVENGGGGSSTAAPIAKQIMDFYLLPDSPLRLADQLSSVSSHTTH